MDLNVTSDFIYPSASGIIAYDTIEYSISNLFQINLDNK